MFDKNVCKISTKEIPERRVVEEKKEVQEGRREVGL